jgi:hypothetical protein
VLLEGCRMSLGCVCKAGSRTPAPSFASNHVMNGFYSTMSPHHVWSHRPKSNVSSVQLTTDWNLQNCEAKPLLLSYYLGYLYSNGKLTNKASKMVLAPQTEMQKMGRGALSMHQETYQIHCQWEQNGEVTLWKSGHSSRNCTGLAIHS